ncbi:MAG: IclR family transcriptional regulator [Anaerovoracaceae bacterium]|nr:IclR family transcriptional regulator [Anaerovoracaceae bacterium]
MGNSENIQSVDRALDIIEVLAVEPEGLGVTEIAGRAGLHKSTAHRIIRTLADRGYLDKTDDGSYKIGLRFIAAVSCYINSLELQTQARPYLAELTGDLGLTAHLGVLDGDQVVYIEKIDVISSVRIYSQIGVHVHAYCSSLGKILLSAYSGSELRHHMARCSFIKFTENTISGIDELERELVQVRKQGWAIDDEESEINHRCIAAPIYDYRGDIIAAVSASGSNVQLPENKFDEVINYVKNTGMAISREMGYAE